MGLSPNTWSAIPYVRHLSLKYGAELHLLGLSTEPHQVWDSSLTAHLENISRSLQAENIVTRTDFVYGNPAVEVMKYVEKNGIDLVAATAGSGNEITCTILSSIAKRMGIKADIPVFMAPSSRLKESDLAEKVAFSRILLPLDCSEAGEAVLPYTESIAQKTGSSVTLLQVSSPTFRGIQALYSEEGGDSRWADKEFLKKACIRLQSQGIKSDYAVVDGTPVKAIRKFAQQLQADLIAIGVRSAAGIENWIFGSAANKVYERTTIPLFTVSYSVPEAIEHPVQDYA
jgi:nucleotide-binding universal stress UspA family protein